MLAMMFSADKKIRIVTKSKVAIHSTISHQINSSEFWPIKGGICHAFRHLGFQIKILLLLSFFVFCNVQVLFHVILISCLCFSFPFLYLVNVYHYYVFYFVYLCFSSSLCLAKFILSR
jgi:hypothetical protein